MGDDRISWNTDWRSGSSNSFNDWAVPKFDKESGKTIIEIIDFTTIGRSESNAAGSREALFSRIWNLLIDQVDR
jgi:hypothetical protein